MHRGPDGYATAGKDGAFRLWDPSFQPITCINLCDTAVGYPSLCIRSVCWAGDKIACGTADSEIFEVSVSDKMNPTTLAQGHADGELWGLAVHPTRPLFITASDDRTLRVWDTTTHECTARKTLKHPARSAQFNPEGDVVAVGLKNGHVFVLQFPGLKLVAKLAERKDAVHSIKFSPDGSVLAVGSNDGFVDFYDAARDFAKLGSSRRLLSFVTQMDFSTSGSTLQVNVGSGDRLFLEAPGGAEVKEIPESTEWHTWTSVLGEEVNGIWGKYTDANDVNATDTTHGSLVASGDDFGKVKLFRYPSPKKGARHRSYSGHSAHVTNVRFSPDGATLLTTGGADHAVFQWKVHADGGQPDGHYHSHSEDSGTAEDYSGEIEIDSDVEREGQQLCVPPRPLPTPSHAPLRNLPPHGFRPLARARGCVGSRRARSLKLTLRCGVRAVLAGTSATKCQRARAGRS